MGPMFLVEKCVQIKWEIPTNVTNENSMKVLGLHQKQMYV